MFGLHQEYVKFLIYSPMKIKKSIAKKKDASVKKSYLLQFFANRLNIIIMNVCNNSFVF